MSKQASGKNEDSRVSRMFQRLAPATIHVNNKPSPCECVDEPNRKVVCAYCVQANLILFAKLRIGETDGVVERARKAGFDLDSLPQTRAPAGDYELLQWIKKRGMAQIARMVGDGVDKEVVRKWVKRGRIPNEYRQLVYELQRANI